MRDVRVEPRALGQDGFYSSDQGDVGQRARRSGLGPVGGCLHLRLSLPCEIILLPGVAHADVTLSSVTDDDRLRKQTPPPRREGAVCLLQKIHAAAQATVPASPGLRRVTAPGHLTPPGTGSGVSSVPQ